MRVIAGKARRTQLKTAEGLSTRPTTDRIKETLFNMIAHGLSDAAFLDLFAGSGGIGIEALSRGAARAVFVEKAPDALACIRENLKRTRMEAQAEVLPMDVMNALAKLNKKERFDYVFMDPPYDHLLEKEALTFLASSALLAEDALVIVEASLATEFPYLDELGFTLVKRKEYKTNAHVFLERRAKPC
ncbi:MAG: 16S rRNA (guanine(966)-N(2))-methyltransferase RsmD [Coprococcus sp.]|nr:16S rRNA (guanine(966)-N(2))-methyltransferase RsmD [Coprococcus sp.]